MRPTKTFNRYPRLYIASIVPLVYLNYELFRVHTGTQPYISPWLEKRGLTPWKFMKKGQFTDVNTNTNTTANTDTDTATNTNTPSVRNQGQKRRDGGWLYLNGVPIPTLDLLMGPFRKD